MTSKKILLVILGIIIVILIAFGFYSFGKNQADSEATSVDNSSTTKPPTETSDCLVNLTNKEKETTKSWKIYVNTNDGYSFMHPADWEVIEQGNTSVILTSDSALFSFQFGVVDEPQGGFLEESRENAIVACEVSEKVSLKDQPMGGENFRREVTQFAKNEKEYTALLSFRFVNESTSNNLKETYDLILKTIEFN